MQSRRQQGELSIQLITFIFREEIELVSLEFSSKLVEIVVVKVGD